MKRALRLVIRLLTLPLLLSPALAVTDLTWDPGTTNTGTQVYTHPTNIGGQYQFRIVTEASVQGGWRTALRITSGDASLYIKQGAEATTSDFYRKSERIGNDGFVLAPNEFAAGQEWFIMVAASAGAQWSLVTGEIFVQDLGLMPWTDSNANNEYEIGEAAGSVVTGNLAIGAEGARYFRATTPAGTPAWSLWLNGAAKDILVRKNQAPVGGSAERSQNGRMLMVSPYLTATTNTVFIGVEGAPGETINLDSRIQPVTDAAFGSTLSAQTFTGPPFKLYRVSVPPEQIGWDVSTTPAAGNPDVALRRGLAAGEGDNDGFSDIGGNAVDGVTLVPPGLSDDTWFITVWSSAASTFTLRNGSPVATPIAFSDVKVNDQPLRAGWRFYALTDIPSQLGKLGWELELSGHVAGTEIALRRNALPGRWNFRNNGLTGSTGYVDFSSITGRLDRPGHQADIWYAGIYMPSAPLGAFTLTTREIPAPVVAFDGSSTVVAGQLASHLQWFRVDVPSSAALKGWELKLTNVTSGAPAITVCRGLLPASIDTGGWGRNSNPSDHITWPQGNTWAQYLDFSGYGNDASGQPFHYRRVVMPMGRPLEPGTYYVGVTAYDSAVPLSYALESRGIGTGFGIPVTLLGDAATPSNAVVGALAAREAKYFRATVPAGLSSWEVVLAPSAGEMVLCARKGVLPAPEYYSNIETSAGKRLQKNGNERYVLLPHDGQEFIDPGDYYFAAVSEGTGPVSFVNIGTGTASGTLQNLGPLVQTNLGTATGGGISQAVTLEAGQIKAFRVLAPASVISLEARLDLRTGEPGVALIGGTVLPTPFDNSGYGYDFGHFTSLTSPTLVTLPNAALGEYRILVRASYDGLGIDGYHPATATLVVTARVPVNVTMNNGSSTVTDQLPGSWRFFRVDVPAGPLGWDLRLTNVTGQPGMVVRRDSLPGFFGTTGNWGHSYDPGWPSGHQWAQDYEYTFRYLEPDFTSAAYRRHVMAMGRPLEPGTYYVGVASPADAAVSYTLESRGIGAGLALPVTTLAFSGGSAVTPPLPPRGAVHYKVTVPANTPSWELRLDVPGPGDMMMWVNKGTVSDAYQGDVLSVGGQRVQKEGSERIVILPPPGQEFLVPGDYFITLASEGTVGSSSVVIGTGDSSGTLTSAGPLAVANLGTVTPSDAAHAISLVSGQVKAYQVTVPAGASSLDVRLDTLTGSPRLTAAPGARLPLSRGYYGWNFGEPSVTFENEFHIVTPAPGVWSFLVNAGDENNGQVFPDAAGTLHISIAAAPSPLTFNGGTDSVTGQAAGTWRFWQVTVPATAGLLGWDLRLVNVTSGKPRLVVRRGQLPEFYTTTGFPEAFTTWPDSARRGAYTDLTHRYREPDARPTDGEFLMSAMGHPLEPGTYFIGVLNEINLNDPLTYTLESRGIGTGQAIAVTDLPLNGSRPVAATPARFAKFFKTTIPPNTPSWEVKLDPTLGDLCLIVRKDFLPDGESTGSVYGRGGRFQQKPDNERFVLLPPGDQIFLVPGDYYLAAVSEGSNPGVPGIDWIGTGSSAGNITSIAPLTVTNLGAVTLADTIQPVSLVTGQLKAYQFTVPAGATAMELRLDNRTGNPGMYLRPGTLLPETFYYASEGGGALHALSHSVISIRNPAAGVWSLCVTTQTQTGDAPAPASADLTVRLQQPQRLNFSSTENGNGFSHMDSRSLLAGQRHFYSVTVPASIGGAEILGWWQNLNASSTQIYLRVLDTPDFSNGGAVTSYTGEGLIMARPYFQPARTWYVEVEALAGLNYTLTSQPATLQHAPYTMPATPGQTFADTGAGLPGDQGLDLAADGWQFLAFDVPVGNGGLLRAELRAINGNPDLLLHRGGIPTPHHYENGPYFPGGAALVDFQTRGNVSEYANWTQPNGRADRELAPGRWYAAIHAVGGTNARYRLLLSTGDVQTLALNGPLGSVSGQNLAPKDVRYYKFTVPLDAPLQWKLTLSEQQGNVRAFIRDNIPPGNQVTIDNDLYNLFDWASDNKNQRPYPMLDSSGVYTLTTPPLRPGSTYYVGVQAVDTAQFSLSSTTAGGSVGTLPVIDFAAGVINTTLAIGERKKYRVPVPASASRWRHAATHDAGVRIIIEQGTIPQESSAHYMSNGANSSLDQPFNNWPWLPGYDYYILLANDSGAPQNVTLTMQGTPGDSDSDGLADEWEIHYFGGLERDGSGDFDHDGIADAIEFALGLNPSRPDTTGLPAAFLAGLPGDQHLALVILLPDPIPPTVKLEVFGSDQPGVGGASIAVRPPGGVWSGPVTPIFGGVRVEDTHLFDSANRRFLWLTVTPVPGP